MLEIPTFTNLREKTAKENTQNVRQERRERRKGGRRGRRERRERQRKRAGKTITPHLIVSFKIRASSDVNIICVTACMRAGLLDIW